jgi:hypothetical protein
LLLSLPVLAGILYIVPALNLAICWELFISKLLTQSAGNLLDLNLLGILRDYTPGFISCKKILKLQLPLNYGNKTNQINYSTHNTLL